MYRKRMAQHLNHFSKIRLWTEAQAVGKTLCFSKRCLSRVDTTHVEVEQTST